MGLGGKIWRFLGSKHSDGNHPKKYKKDGSRKGLDYAADGLGFDEEDTNLATALSLSEQDPPAQQETQTDSKSESVKAQLEKDEQFAKTLQESLNKDESSSQLDVNRKYQFRAQLDLDEHLALTLQQSLNADSHDVREKSGQKLAENQMVEDEQLAKALQESLNTKSPPHQLVEHEKGSAITQTDDDVQLAKALQESLNTESHPLESVENEKKSAEKQTMEDEKLAEAVQESLYGESSPRKCAGCTCKIDSGRFVRCLDSFWHPECLQCHGCKKPITDDCEFSKSKRRIYHNSCYKERRHPKCIVCKESVPLNKSGKPTCSWHPFWQDPYCPSHESDGTPKCCSCERLEQINMKYLMLDDGRKLCLECLHSGIMDTDECQPLYFDIREYYEGLHMKVEQEFPLLLVERQALNHAREEEKHGYHDVVQTRGICLSEEQTVVSVLKGPKRAGNRLVDIVKESRKLVRPRQCEVTAILIIYGLPRLLTGSILAHEMMHAWLRLKGYPDLQPEIEEGICQVLAHMWLESEKFSEVDAAPSSSSPSSSAITSKKGKQPDFTKKLSELFKYQIENDSSPVYGEGFKKANHAVGKYGLEWTLKHIEKTGKLP